MALCLRFGNNYNFESYISVFFVIFVSSCQIFSSNLNINMQPTEIQAVKQRFGIIGTSDLLNRAIDIAVQVAPTDLSVLITGESGVGKENFPQIIHHYSHRKHGPYIAVNCGAENQCSSGGCYQYEYGYRNSRWQVS